MRTREKPGLGLPPFCLELPSQLPVVLSPAADREPAVTGEREPPLTALEWREKGLVGKQEAAAQGHLLGERGAENAPCAEDWG